MGEKPVASCRASVFAVEPPSKQWTRVGNSVAACGLYHNSTKGTYRIIGYLGEKGKEKAVLNSYITAKTNYRKASAKFWQWTNPTNKKLCGLTFPGEAEGDKFGEKVHAAIESLKEAAASTADDGGSDSKKPVKVPPKKPVKAAPAAAAKDKEPAKPAVPRKTTITKKPPPKPVKKAPPPKPEKPKKTRDKQVWEEVEYRGVAIYNFTPAEGGQHQIALSLGDAVEITEKIAGWYLGSNTRSGETGIFPASYVQIVTIDLGDRPLLEELASQVREWVELCRTAYEEGDVKKFRIINSKIEELKEARENIIITSSREQEAVYVAKSAGIRQIEQGRRELGFAILTLTDNGEVADDQNSGIYDLWRMHEAVSEIDTGMDNSSSGPAAKGPVARLASEKRAGTSSGTEGKADNQIINLVLEWKSFICPMGQDNSQVELFFSLYSNQKKETISDEFCVLLTDKGQPLDQNSKESDHRCIFRDVSPADVASDLYMVCRIVRLGKMINDDSKQKNPQDFRRFYGVCILKLTPDVLASKDVASLHQLKIYSHSPKADNCEWCLHDNVINQSGDYAPVEVAMGCAVTLQATTGIFNEKEWAGKGLIDLKVVDKIQYEVIMPGEVRNDLYVRFDQGEFSKDVRNAEVTVRLIQNSGDVLENCISHIGRPRETEYRSIVLYHETRPRFNEFICVNVPREYGDKAHLYISVRHCSTGEAKADNKPIAFTFLRLNDPDGTMVKDGEHTLPLYKSNKDERGQQACWYLTEQDPKKLILRKNETLVVTTTLTSTLLTQNAALLNLLKWRKASNLPSVLDRFLYTSKTDVVKFFQDIFDSLFDILEEHSEVSKAVYNAIVFLLGHMAEERGQNVEQFKKVLNIYISEHFKGYNAHRHLAACLKEYLADPKKNRKDLQSSIKALEYIFKLIIQSRQLYMDKFNVDASEESFMKEMDGLVDSFADLMDINDPVLIGPQTLALRKFQTLFGNLTVIFDFEWVAKEAVKFIRAIKTHDQKTLIVEKVKFLQATTEGELLMQEDARPCLFPVIVESIMEQIQLDREDVFRMLPVVGALLNHVTMFSEEDRVSYMKQVEPIVEHLTPYFLEFEGTGTVDGLNAEEKKSLGSLMAVFLSLFHLFDASHHKSLYNAAKKKRRGESWVSTVFDIINRILSLSIVPADWFVINILRPRLSLKVLRTFEVILRDDFLAAKAFNNDLWVNFFRLLVATIQAPDLQLEKQSKMNQQRVLTSYGDLRLDAVALLKDAWANLGAQQDQFVPSLAKSMLDLMALDHDDVRNDAMNIYFVMLDKDFKKNKSLREMEMATIDGFNMMVGEKRATHAFRTFFEDALTKKATSISDAAFASALKDYTRNVTQLIVMSLQLMALPKDELFNDDRIYATIKLMDYLKSIQRYEGYIQYVYQVVDCHVRSGDSGEAGYAQLLHADLLEFSEEELPAAADGRFPAQTSRERKIQVLSEALEHLATGQCWEKALEICRLVRQQYEDFLFDYAKASEIAKRESEFLKNIVKTDRLARAYYRCGFFGTSFADTLRNKEFVFRGAPLEQLSVFQSKLTRKFPGAVFLPNKPVPDDVKEKEGYYIQVAKTEADLNREAMPKVVAKGVVLPKFVTEYYNHNRITTFKMSRPLKKEGVTKNKENEFATLWLLETYLHLDGEFPGPQTRLLVADRSEVELSPISNAKRSLEEKNAELRDFYTKYSSGQGNPSPYTMALNGCILALVNGGVMMYADAFFTDEYKKANPDHEEIIQECKDLLGEQVTLLGEGLVLHSKIVQDEMRALHNTLEDYFSKMKGDIEKVLK